MKSDLWRISCRSIVVSQPTNNTNELTGESGGWQPHVLGIDEVSSPYFIISSCSHLHVLQVFLSTVSFLRHVMP